MQEEKKTKRNGNAETAKRIIQKRLDKYFQQK